MRYQTLSRAAQRAFSSEYALHALAALVLLGLVVYGLLLPNALERADMRFGQGEYHAALAEYARLYHEDEQQRPQLLVRLGMLAALRGEYATAEHRLWLAATHDLDAQDHALATIYLGHVIANQQQVEDAHYAWNYPGPCDGPPGSCPYDGARQILAAEWALRSGDYATARADYRAALAMPLQADWHMLAVYRLALLQAADTPELARATLETARTTEEVLPPAPLLAPLLPERMRPDSEQLYAILQTDADSRAQLLGQFYLDNRLYDLAVAQFEIAERGRKHPISATAHAAYAHMLAGDISASTGQLEQMVSKYPADSRAQMLLALTRIAQHGPNTTEPVTVTLQTLALDKPDTHLAWAAWYVSQADYIQASRSYRIATELAPPEQRGQYAIWAARFHLNTAYEICTDGMAAAERAVDMLPDDADAWTVLAGSRYQCRDFQGAVTAARHAIARADEPRADASFYLGASLANLGYNNEARDQLLHACDLDPDSIWRRRAENVLRDLF